MNNNSISIRFQVNSQKVEEEFKNVLSSIGGFDLQQSSDSVPCDLLIMEIGDKPDIEFRTIDDIKTQGIIGDVFLTSQFISEEILVRALRTGAKEFFPQPINREDVRNALLDFKTKRGHAHTIETPSKKGKIIDVLGSKGGVGTTTVSVNLATNLIKLEGVRSVALIDMNLLFGEVPVFLGIKPTFDWIEIVKNVSRLDATYLRSTLFKHSSGIYVLPAPNKILTNEYKATPQVIERILELMCTMFDYIIIDSGQSLDGIAKGLLKISDTVILIAVSTLPCLINVKKILSIFRDYGYPHEQNIKIIMNRFHKNSVISLKDAEDSIKRKVMCSIPNDYQLSMSAINQGKPLSVLENKAEISKCFISLATSITGQTEKKKESFLRRFRLGNIGLKR